MPSIARDQSDDPEASKKATIAMRKSNGRVRR